MLLGEATNRLKEFGSARVHTALALNGLEKDGADLIAHLLEKSLYGLDIVSGHRNEAVRQRLKGLLFGRLGCCGERSERAAVEAALQSDDRARNAVGAGFKRLATCMQTRKLDSALVCLGAGVREKRLPGLALILGHRFIQQLGQVAGELAAVLDVVVITDMDQARSLLCQCRA